MAKEISLTFFRKNPTTCPVCEKPFYQEDMRQGRGRIISGPLTNELRRTYEPSKFGEVFPHIYYVVVCPSCLYAAFPEDFSRPPAPTVSKLQETTDARERMQRLVVPAADFSSERGLNEGLASFLLAVLSYDAFPKEFSPTVKQGISSLHAAWAAGDLHAKHSSENWDYLARVFYRKARFFYSEAVIRESDGTETLSGAKELGPDFDHNYGYDGVLYVSGMLEYHYGPKSNPAKRKEALDRAKRTIARIFGMGRASKNKPADLLDRARDAYAEITEEMGMVDADPENDPG